MDKKYRSKYKTLGVRYETWRKLRKIAARTDKNIMDILDDLVNKG